MLLTYDRLISMDEAKNHRRRRKFALCRFWLNDFLVTITITKTTFLLQNEYGVWTVDRLCKGQPSESSFDFRSGWIVSNAFGERSP